MIRAVTFFSLLIIQATALAATPSSAGLATCTVISHQEKLTSVYDCRAFQDPEFGLSAHCGFRMQGKFWIEVEYMGGRLETLAVTYKDIRTEVSAPSMSISNESKKSDFLIVCDEEIKPAK